MGIADSDIPSYLEFLSFIDAPQNLKYLGAVLENVKAALERNLLSEIDELFTSGHLDVDQLIRYKEHCNFLLKTLVNYPDHYKRPHLTNVKEVMQGLLTTHPFYVIVFMNAKHNQTLYCAFHQIILFFSHLVKFQNAKNNQIDFKEYEKNTLCAIFRKFSTDNEITQWYKNNQPDSISSVKDFIHQFKLLEDELRAYNTNFFLVLAESCRSFIEILNLSVGRPKPRKNFYNSKKRKKPKNEKGELTGYSALRGEMLLPLTLPDIRDEDDVIFSFSMLDEEEYNEEALESGEEKAEQESKDVFIFQTSQSIKSYVRAYHGKCAAKALMARIERQNNYLPSSLQRLSAFEIQNIFINLKQQPENANELIKQLIVIVMFFTSCEFHQAISVINKSKQINFKEINELHFCHKSKNWVMPAYQPSYLTPFEDKFGERNLKWFYLPTTSLCQERFEKLLNNDFRNKTINDEIRTLTENDLKKFIDTFGINGLKLSRIKNHFFQTCCSQFGQAIAALTFNRDAPGSNARNFYATHSNTFIQEHYTELLNKTIDSINASAQIALPENLSIGWVGARYRPEIQDIRKGLVNIRSELEKLQKSLVERGNWIRFHNLYVCYQILAQSLLTGMRPINSPLVQPEHLLYSDGIYVRLEKAQENQFNTRHIPVCDLTLALNDAYKQHFLAVKGRLLRKNIDPDTLPTLFFLTGTCSIETSIIKAYKKILFAFIKHPPNFNRKLLRNFLEQQRVSHEVIDVALGHANFGEQYWGQYSTLSMREIREYLKPHMEIYKSQLDIKLVVGLKA